MRQLNGYSVLIVQEDPLAAMVLAHVVQDEGGKPTVCATAKEAILAVKLGRVAAAILDEALLHADVCGELQRRAIPYVLHDALAEVHGGLDSQSADALIGKVVEALHGTRRRA